jgi:hypothetical protein
MPDQRFHDRWFRVYGRGDKSSNTLAGPSDGPCSLTLGLGPRLRRDAHMAVESLIAP